MEQYDPYTALLTELMAGNDWPEETMIRHLNEAREFVRGLRSAYGESPSHVDFGNPFVRDAYLLAYYPKYTEPIFTVLNSLPPKFSDFFESDRVRGCFLGAGPGAEVIGWIRYLKECKSTPTHAHAYLLDKEFSGWHKGHEITRYHIAPGYWAGKLVISAHTFDFYEELKDEEEHEDQETSFNRDPFISQAFRESRLFVMQNCINDQLGSRQAFSYKLLRIFEEMPLGSLFIIIDLAFQDVLSFIRNFEREVVDQYLGNIISPVKGTREEVYASIAVPDIVRCELFHPSENGLILSTRVRFRYSILERADVLPF